MANLLKSITYSGNTNYANAYTYDTVYTVPTGATSIIIGLAIANIKTDVLTVSAKLFDDDLNQDVFFIKDVVIASGATLEVMGGNKIILNANDVFSMSADSPNSFDVVMSLVEQS